MKPLGNISLVWSFQAYAGFERQTKQWQTAAKDAPSVYGGLNRHQLKCHQQGREGSWHEGEPSHDARAYIVSKSDDIRVKHLPVVNRARRWSALETSRRSPVMGQWRSIEQALSSM
jgi:hypothetical protein